jgi:nitrogen fixation protein NifU and related proteins
MKYNAIVRQHFFAPYHLGEWPLGADDIVSTSVGSYSLGAVVQLQVKHNHGAIIDTRFKAYGNPYVIAAASYIAQQLMGQSLKDAASISYDHIMQALQLPLAQQYCAILLEDAIRSVLETSMVEYEYE